MTTGATERRGDAGAGGGRVGAGGPGSGAGALGTGAGGGAGSMAALQRKQEAAAGGLSSRQAGHGLPAGT